MAVRRTDLAAEAHQLWRESAGETTSLAGVKAEEGEREGFPTQRVDILDGEGAAALGKPEGVYITLELEGVLRREEGAFRRGVAAVAGELAPLLPEGPALVVGLGNRAITPDLIGPLTVEKLLVTRHLVEGAAEHFGHLRPVAALAPGVLGDTGVESGELAAALAGAIRPACVIAVDALAARSVGRLCRTVQIADTGIVPGSGVGNHRRGLTRETLGVPVIAVGVPTVVDAATLCLDLLGGEEADPALLDRRGEDLFVTPREVDSRVADFGKLLGWAITLALNPSLTADDLELLLE